MSSNKNNQDFLLISNFQKTGDYVYFEKIYDKYTDLVFRKCLSYLKNEQDAQDSAQEIWTKVYFALIKFEHKSSFSTWLYRITSNNCINLLKKRKVFVSLEALSEKGFELEDMEDDILTILSDEDDVTKLLATLSKDMKALILMKYLDAYTYEEIAQLTNCTISAVKMQISRSKKHLKKTFLHKEDE